jgi:hypothetical protein
MRTVIFTLPFVLMAGAAVAQGGPDATTMSCAAAQQMVQQQGAVVLWNGPNVMGRYVSGQQYCDVNTFIAPAWIQTQDNPQCLVGNYCQQQNQ